MEVTTLLDQHHPLVEKEEASAEKGEGEVSVSFCGQDQLLACLPQASFKDV